MADNQVVAFRCADCGCIDVRYGVHFQSEHVSPDAPGFEGEFCPGDPVEGTWTPHDEDDS